MIPLSRRRPAFTLIELLVAVGIIAMLLGLVAISFPRFNEREQLTRAVDKLRTGLLTARLWAKRDQVVTGIKFLRDPDGMYYGYQFVQQPVVPAIGKINNFYPAGSLGPISITTGNTTFINPGKDWLVISGLVPHAITAGGNSSLTLKSALDADVLGQTNYRIIHGPTPISMQEDVILQPDSRDDPAVNPAVIFVDSATTNLTDDSVLFLPAGNVINQGSGKILFSINQRLVDPNASPELAEVILDCMSGTNRYISPY